MICLQFIRPAVPGTVSRSPCQRYIGAKGFQFMDAELHRIERYASKEVAEILRKMNVIFQHERVFALRLRDQTPSSGMTQKATGFPGAEMAPAWIGPVWVMLCL